MDLEYLLKLFSLIAHVPDGVVCLFSVEEYRYGVFSVALSSINYFEEMECCVVCILYKH